MSGYNKSGIDEMIVSVMGKETENSEMVMPIEFTEAENALYEKYKQAMIDAKGNQRAANRKMFSKPAFRLGSYKFGK